jgi:uncharacterized membrane protein (UPF0127 family)
MIEEKKRAIVVKEQEGNNQKWDSQLRKGSLAVCQKVHYCSNIFSKGFGLMFRREKSVKDTAWVFYFKKQRRISLTMLFVFFPIDVIFLDDKKTIVEMTVLKPWSFYNPAKYANYCIELRQGTIDSFKLKIGDSLNFS